MIESPEETGNRRRQEDRDLQEILSRLNRLEDSYYKISSTVVRLETIVENFSKLVERFNDTLDKMTDSLNGLNVSIVKINGRVEDNTIEITDMKTSLITVRKSIKDVDDKSKIDFLQIVSQNLGKFIFGGGIFTGIIMWIDHLVDTYLKVK
jgi:predicted RNA-binding protein with EMAP domain